MTGEEGHWIFFIVALVALRELKKLSSIKDIPLKLHLFANIQAFGFNLQTMIFYVASSSHK